MILLTLLAINCKGQSQIYSDKNFILLVDYNEYTSCKVLEVDGKKVDHKKQFCSAFSGIVDDFSEYFPIKKVFYYDGELELKGNEMILFWDYDFKKAIDSLPFSYSKVIIKTLLNDSTITINLKGKELILRPNEIYNDTNQIITKEENKLLEYTTYFSIENIGLIRKENVIDNKKWEYKRKELKLDAPTTAEIMPEFEGGMNEFQKYLIENIKYPVIGDVETINTKLFIEFIIDEKGNVSMSRVIRSINPTIDNNVLEIISKMPKWKPGMNNGVAVPVKMIIPINIELK